MSALLDFHRGTGTDAAGRRRADILAWSDARLEAVHDYIQWLFPLPERSAFNPHAPLLTGADIAVFRAEPALQTALREGLARMQRFYGFDAALQVAGPLPWLTPGNHNFLRITRILRCLTLLGLAADARAFLAALERLDDPVIGARTRRFWAEAVRHEGVG
jgi:hypothetical protein